MSDAGSALDILLESSQGLAAAIRMVRESGPLAPGDGVAVICPDGVVTIGLDEERTLRVRAIGEVMHCEELIFAAPAEVG